MLCIVFLSIATYNLGYTQTPTTTLTASDGQSFYVDFGHPVEVKSVVFLLKGGAINASTQVGTPDNWNGATYYVTWRYESSQWKEDYYKWHEQGIPQVTQYLRFDFGTVGTYNTTIAEIAVIDENNQTVPIESLVNLGAGNPNFQAFFDEQTMIQYPSDYMSNTYFDEIYFVRTAEQYLNLQIPYEWTHPPLGKLIQALGIVTFGFSPFGWRIMGVIFAMLMIPLIYLMGKKLFGTWIGGFSAAFLLTFDFMHFTMARMGTADTYLVFFSVASQLLFLIYFRNVLKEGWQTSTVPLFLAVLFFTLSFATKWIALYGLIAELLILAALRFKEVKALNVKLYDRFYAFTNHPYSYLIGFLFIAAAIYFALYIPDMLAGRSFLDVLNTQVGMYSYHSQLTATHSFSSPWYTWPLMFDPFSSATHVPLWLESASLPYNFKSTIVLLGNPAVWWVGFAAVLALTGLFLGRGGYYLIKNWRANKNDAPKVPLKINLPTIFILTFFFIQWVPYILISRVVFIYHFYLCIPFMMLATTYFINKIWRHPIGKLATLLYFALVVTMFVLFYPVISGEPTTTSTIDSLKWFSGWLF
ncbi:MAG: glycosyltransferase family 39 protein [Candidatus Bathyarchaeota archaeon]|nr:glycosyltransferase family 39 protein [Candidatus Bathyarchaeota archaeon]